MMALFFMIFQSQQNLKRKLGITSFYDKPTEHPVEASLLAMVSTRSPVKPRHLNRRQAGSYRVCGVFEAPLLKRSPPWAR
ncbi:hypothetical protein [Pseudomonas sp. MWU12-2345]|uniref:hypothetical protein n=1 Tax=Pseudomonas sp. MWU12-2345 TaxID=2928689 RepID=UPI00200DC40C|nr:hypothetical protein [Pseudomonas sp. MWU12-2345]